MDISKYDNIDNSMFLTKIDNIYVMLCTSIMMGDLTRVKHKVSSDIIDRYNALVNDYNNKKIRKMYDELNVKSTTIDSIDVVDGDIVVKVKLVSRYLDYFIDFNGNYVSGDNKCSHEHINYLTFVKKCNAGQLGIVRQCPNCGANIDVNNDGRCIYCDGVFNTEDFDYILVDIKE